MLTPTDVHLLVGLLTQASSPDNVEVKLGDFIYDIAAEKLRDVDVTVRSPVPNVDLMKGIEVKKHKHPLDVTHVEQLVRKLKDMPSINQPQIVSASGYTKGAIHKAAAHDVELLKLTDWDQSQQSFPHVDFRQLRSLTVRHPEWVQSPNVSLDVQDAADIATADPASVLVTDEAGNPHSSGVTFDQFKINIMNQVTDNWAKQEGVSELPVGVPRPITASLSFTDDPHLRAGDSVRKVTGARVQGVLQWQTSDCPLEYKILLSESTGKLIVGCALAELPTGNLMGITASSADRTIKMINVAISSRNLRIIREMRLGGSK